MKNEKEKQETGTKEDFDSVEYFRSIKQKLAERMKDMTLKEQKAFMKKVKEGEIKID